MTAPRRVLPGTTYLVTRRCSERRYFLRPDRITTTVFRFVLALAARRYGVRLHAFCVLSNHFHLVLTDPKARLPIFMQYLDGLVGRALNARRGRWEHFWDDAPYSAVVLATPRDVLEKAAYVLANPVAAGLVRRASEWPGLWSAPASLTTGPEAVTRPEGFFRRCGAVPTSVLLHLTAPPGFGSAAEFRACLEAALAELERRHSSERRDFLGAQRVLAQAWWARPLQVEPRRGLRPGIAARGASLRVELLEALRAFRAAYRDAWLAWRQGKRGTVFPAGTYALRVLHGAPCRPAG
jgi:REP element-mobilizing transposase RayT